MLGLEPERLDPGAQRQVFGQLINLRAHTRRRPAPRGALDRGEPDREPELAKRQAVVRGRPEVSSLHVLPDPREGGREQRLDQAAVVPLWSELRDAICVPEQAAETEGIVRRQ